MARDHARLQTAIWNDPEFRALPGHAQHAYTTIISQPRLSYCGVLDYIPSRLAALSDDGTEAKIKASVKALERARFVVVDRTTHELAVRTYIKHDGVLNRPNMGKAMGRALANVVSDRLRGVIRDELSVLYGEKPELAGWIGFKAESPIEYDIACGMASAMQLPIESGA